MELTDEQRAQLCPVIGLLLRKRLSEAAQKAMELGYLITVRIEMERGEGLHPSGIQLTLDPDGDHYALDVLSVFELLTSLRTHRGANDAA